MGEELNSFNLQKWELTIEFDNMDVSLGQHYMQLSPKIDVNQTCNCLKKSSAGRRINVERFSGMCWVEFKEPQL